MLYNIKKTCPEGHVLKGEIEQREELLNNAGFMPGLNGRLDIGHGLLGRDLVLVAEGFAKGISGKFAMRLRGCFGLFPEECGGLVEGDHLVEIDERHRLAN